MCDGTLDFILRMETFSLETHIFNGVQMGVSKIGLRENIELDLDIRC